MADILEVSKRYNVPTRCFTSKVPFVLQVGDDHTIFPSRDINLHSPGGTRSKWIRIARYQDFVDACEAYLRSTGGVVMHDRLNVFVLPYMPVEDAFLVHELVMNPDPMPTSYADAVQMLQAQVEGEVGVEQEEKRGVIPMPEFALNMEFVVSNYQVLWSKSKTKCMLDFLSDPMLQLVQLASICDQLLGNDDDSDEESDRLDASIEEARRQLIFSMYQSNVSDADLHHVIVFMYPAVHSAVYHDCQHCVVAMHFDDVVNSPETDTRLESSMVFLGYQQGHAYPAVEDAAYKLLMIEGRAEYHNYKSQTKQEFATAREVMKTSLTPLMHQIVLARRQLSLMGVTNSHEEE